MKRDLLKCLDGKCGRKLKLVRQYPIKLERDYLLHFILQDTDTEQLIICAIATNSYQIFALQRSLTMIHICKDVFEPLFRINMPIGYGEIEEYGYSYVMYEYIDGLRNVDNDDSRPLDALREVYKQKAVERVVDQRERERILDSILEDFPQEARANIEKTEEFQKYCMLLKCYKTLWMIPTHADFSPSNIWTKNGDMFLMDFEQGASLLPIGYDLFHYLKFIGRLQEDAIPYYDLNEAYWAIRHISHSRRGMDKYLPEVNIGLQKEDSFELTVTENERKFVLGVRRERNSAYIDFQFTEITPYAFWTSINSLFRFIKKIDRVMVIMVS